MKSLDFLAFVERLPHLTDELRADVQGLMRAFQALETLQESAAYLRNRLMAQVHATHSPVDLLRACIALHGPSSVCHICGEADRFRLADVVRANGLGCCIAHFVPGEAGISVKT